jgi:hypothetical protein
MIAVVGWHQARIMIESCPLQRINALIAGWSEMDH